MQIIVIARQCSQRPDVTLHWRRAVLNGCEGFLLGRATGSRVSSVAAIDTLAFVLLALVRRGSGTRWGLRPALVCAMAFLLSLRAYMV